MSKWADTNVADGEDEPRPSTQDTGTTFGIRITSTSGLTVTNCTATITMTSAIWVGVNPKRADAA